MVYTQHTYTVETPAAIKTVILTDADVPIEVLSSRDSSMYATYYTSDKETYDIAVDGATLCIRKKVRIMAGFFAFLSTPKDIKLTMYLPKDYAGDLNATTADGDITVRGVTASSLAIKATDGDVFMSQSRIDGSAVCKTLDGDIRVGSIVATDVSLRTTDGDILLDRPIISDKLSCRATDGDVMGILTGRVSDYTFTVRTGDGSSNITSGGTGKTLCEMKTADGDIKISFEREA